MTLKRIFLAALLVSGLIAIFVLRSAGPQYPHTNYEERNRLIVPTNSGPPQAQPEGQPEPVATQSVQELFPRIKSKLSEFTPAQREEFEKDFQEKYQPAIQKWCSAYKGHVPFDPYDVTRDNFAERVGREKRYREFVFVVNGITLGVRDSRAAGVSVDYLNAPQQTRQMTVVPDGSQAPITVLPVSREDVQAMLQTDGWQDTNEWMEIIPTGLSGSLNGGAMVHVGGNSDNGASWKYDLIFGPDGKLAYYLRGVDAARELQDVQKNGPQ